MVTSIIYSVTWKYIMSPYQILSHQHCQFKGKNSLLRRQHCVLFFYKSQNLTYTRHQGSSLSFHILIKIQLLAELYGFARQNYPWSVLSSFSFPTKRLTNCLGVCDILWQFWDESHSRQNIKAFYFLLYLSHSFPTSAFFF